MCSLSLLQGDALDSWVDSGSPALQMDSLSTEISGNSSWTISNPKRWYCESAALSIPVNLENSEVATGLGKVSLHSNPKERQCQRMFKLLHNCTHLTCYKVMLKILQARLQQYVIWELPDVQAGFRKGKRIRDQIANICWIIGKKSSRKTPISALLTIPSLWLCGSQQTVGNCSRVGNSRPPDLPPEKSVSR